MNPIFIVVKTDGKIYATSSAEAAAAMTGVAATFRVNSLTSTQLLGTITDVGPYTVSGTTGVFGAEIK